MDMTGTSPKLRKQIIYALASKEGNARYISEKYNRSVDWLRSFVEENKEELQEAREALEESQSTEDTEPSPAQLGELWISNKTERLKRYQEVADQLFEHLTTTDPTDSTVLREFRSYLAAVANELGQLLNRGSGDANVDDPLNVIIEGVDMDKLR